MTRYIFSITLAVLLTAAAGFPGGPEVLLLQTFDNDTVGQVPGTPEIGTFWDASNVNRKAIVIDVNGNRRIESIDPDSTDGFVMQWTPTSEPTKATISFTFRIESYTTTPNQIAIHELFSATASGSENVYILWYGDNTIRFDGLVPSFTWTTNTDYDVSWEVDCNSDTTSLIIDGTTIVKDKALSIDCVNIKVFNSADPIDATMTQSIDTVKMVRDIPIFTDDFETGNTDTWTDTVEPTGGTGDSCSSARVYPSETIQLGDLGDNTASGENDTCGTSNTIDEWFSYTAACTGTVTVTTCHTETEFDSTLSVWQGSDCGSLSEVACNDDAAGAPSACDLNGSNRKSIASYSATAGVTYYFRVTAYSDNLGSGAAFAVSADCTP